MKSDEIRSAFLTFFASKGHKIVASDSLVPQNDASVLFTSAGMNQFKEQFMGKISDFRRAASCQKCLRTADMVNVGKSPTHHTFFEMLGNFSFGDYFKEDAICWAWEFITGVLKLPTKNLWISVHKNDFEAYLIWKEKVGIPESKIVKLGDKDNFWPANAPAEGPNGPCGPCSEIFYDWGEQYGCKKADCNPACDCRRFTEIWNLVFTQYDRQSNGSLNPLPSKNIDTGMGLERIVSVMQNVRENYATDLFVPILQALNEQLKKHGVSASGEFLDSKAKAIADHIRAACFAIADGVVPSNEARGYVIRKLIRRSIVNLKHAGIRGPLCYSLVFSIANTMKHPYPEILRRHEMIAGIIKKEEEMFWEILKERAPAAESAFKELSESFHPKLNTDEAIKKASLCAFMQYDTYGVPLEISRELAQKYGLEIKEEDFENEMEEQRLRSRSKTQISSVIFAKTTGHLLHDVKSTFAGYENLEFPATVIAIIKGNSLINSASENEEADIVLDNTPFYAESGGQAGDTGALYRGTDFEAQVMDTVKIDEAIIHKAKILKGTIKKADKLKACVAKEKRISTCRNHTATHLLQYALRKALGSHVEQSGSYVSWEKLRFDFSHLKSLQKETILEIEKTVNDCIWANLPVTTEVMSKENAKNSGALAFFGEKYAENVRVLSVGNCSKEFCGGTHVKSSGEIGVFKIVSESSIAQGIRRIEAVTAEFVIELTRKNENILSELAGIFKTPADKLFDAAGKLLLQIKYQEKELQKLKIEVLAKDINSIIKNAQRVNNIPVIISEAQGMNMNDLRQMSDLLKSKQDPVICVLASIDSEKQAVVVGVSQSLAEKGVDAVKIIKEITAKAGGGGGGKKELAQAGTKDSGALRQGLKNSVEIIKMLLTR